MTNVEHVRRWIGAQWAMPWRAVTVRAVTVRGGYTVRVSARAVGVAWAWWDEKSVHRTRREALSYVVARVVEHERLNASYRARYLRSRGTRTARCAG